MSEEHRGGHWRRPKPTATISSLFFTWYNGEGWEYNSSIPPVEQMTPELREQLKALLSRLLNHQD